MAAYSPGERGAGATLGSDRRVVLGVFVSSAIFAELRLKELKLSHTELAAPLLSACWSAPPFISVLNFVVLCTPTFVEFLRGLVISATRDGSNDLSRVSWLSRAPSLVHIGPETASKLPRFQENRTATLSQVGSGDHFAFAAQPAAVSLSRVFLKKKEKVEKS